MELKPYSTVLYSLNTMRHEDQLDVLKAEEMHIHGVWKQPFPEVSLQILLDNFQTDVPGTRNQEAGRCCIAIA